MRKERRGRRERGREGREKEGSGGKGLGRKEDGGRRRESGGAVARVIQSGSVNKGDPL